jgi:predicted Rossmann fold nucleotide-binding protein DprA/Smf involved in DNA uptake
MDDLSETQQDLLTRLQQAEDGLHINLLVQQTERPYSEVSSDLMMLELQGLVRSLPGGIYRFMQ